MALSFQVGDLDLRGTHKVGSLTIRFDELVAKFGEPNWTKYTRDDLPKTYCEWNIEISDEDEDEISVVAIYDWKLPDDAHPRDNTTWNVGGRNFRDLDRLMKILGMI